MKSVIWSLTFVAGILLVGAAWAKEPSLTVYNQGFGVVRESIDLDLNQGVNQVRFTDITAHLEPDSVILRDPQGKRSLRILEQNFRGDPISQNLLLSLYEGETIDFLVRRGEKEETVRGRIIRSGYVPHQMGFQRFGQQYYQRQMSYAKGSFGQPVIEVDGQLRFSLPGIPLFPTLKDDTILKPTLNWVLESSQAGKFPAELSYVTGGMTWAADYNLVAPEEGDVLEMIGWVTMDNQTGRTFENARIKLMAGDVRKIQDQSRYGYDALEMSSRMGGFGGAAPVAEKTFDEYHLYTLQRPTTLHDRETKQVEFIRAAGIESERIYVYDGAKIDWNRYRGWNQESIRQDAGYGTISNPKVWVMREFENSEENNLGIPLPKGRLRFYRSDEGSLEFTGENMIDHTPKDETVRVYTGNAFDLLGERKRTYYYIDHGQRWLDESFEIKLRNHKDESVEVRVVEHMYRCPNWDIRDKSDDFGEMDSKTIEFRVTLEPDQEKVVTYKVHYSW